MTANINRSVSSPKIRPCVALPAGSQAGGAPPPRSIFCQLLVPGHSPQARHMCITIWDFTGRNDSSGNQRESPTSSISAGPAPLFPQGWRSSPGHSAPARSAPTAMAVIHAARHAGPRPGRDGRLLPAGFLPAMVESELPRPIRVQAGTCIHKKRSCDAAASHPRSSFWTWYRVSVVTWYFTGTSCIDWRSRNHMPWRAFGMAGTQHGLVVMVALSAITSSPLVVAAGTPVA